MRIVARLPVDGIGVLDSHAVDRLLIGVHTELQRLSEELRIGERVIHLLSPLNTAIRATTGQPGPYRLVDIGCGLGGMGRLCDRTKCFAPTGAIWSRRIPPASFVDGAPPSASVRRAPICHGQAMADRSVISAFASRSKGPIEGTTGLATTQCTL
ncbi:hypothetical protein [Streptomyces sp. SBT349]|uniref:hypothetical protein n=1 Tax=Streptomyces sp. SBT349 TaxID=1580539 RepID=UPI0018FEB3C2|nr:hypothetical protein [Streptomyces sp. SBT349]